MSDGKVLHGQQYDSQTGVRRFTRQVKDYSGPTNARVTGDEGAPAKEIAPLDEAAAAVTTWNTSAQQEVLDAIFVTFPSTIDLPLPRELLSLQVLYNKSEGIGASNFPVSQQGSQFVNVQSGTASIRPRASAQASASIVPDVVPTFAPEKDGRETPATVCLFYMALGTTREAILTRLSAALETEVLDWPRFKPVALTLTLFGQQVSISQSAETSASVSAAGEGYSYDYQWGDSFSEERGVSVRSMSLPAALFNTGVLTGDLEDTADASTTVVANSIDLYINLTVIVDAITNEPAALEKAATGSVVASSSAATVPAAIPTEGLFLAKLDTELFDITAERYMVRAVVIDASVYA